ncbi:hypothetical protein C4K35_4745 [Pseudomonas chlororaphis subsp. piscium]|nr:hypothetical protein [Pseudomonas chlororaphis]AZC52314.1 hypothetical protein C4K35_4745 [Pseudomonas chlororaphis subsp. piscium]
MKSIYWVLAAGVLVVLMGYGVARESAGTCQLPSLSMEMQR